MSKEYPCVHWNEGKCKKFSDDKATSWCVESPCEYQTPSNADHIRAMSDKELANWLVSKTVYQESAHSSPSYLNFLTGSDDTKERAVEDTIKWLKQTAEVE